VVLQFDGFTKAYVRLRREVLYNILIEFGIPRKLVMPIIIIITIYLVFQRSTKMDIELVNR